jgi:hypothetical protein
MTGGASGTNARLFAPSPQGETTQKECPKAAQTRAALDAAPFGDAVSFFMEVLELLKTYRSSSQAGSDDEK